MYNIYRLLKNYVLNFLGTFLKKFKTPKFYVAIVICILFSAMIIGTFTLNSISSIQIYVDQNVEHPELLAMFSTTTLALMMLLFVTIMRSVYPNKGNDHDLLMSMPIKKIEIVVAKSIYNYLFDLIIFLSILMPSYIVYYVLIPNASIYVITRGLTFVFILPLISNAIASFIGIWSDKMSRMFRRYSLIQTLISLALVAGYLVLNYSLQNYLTKVTGSAIDVVNSIYIIDFILDFILYGSGINLVIILVLAIVLYVASLLYTSSQFGRMKKEKTQQNKTLSYKTTPIIISLTKKELKQYLNTPIYLINTIVPMVLYLGLSVASCIFGKEFAMAFVSTLPQNFLINFDVLTLMILSILVSGFVTTGSSVSLEGKYFWIIRTNPIKTSNIFASKILMNVLISTIFILIGFPFILSFIDSINFWWFILVPIFTSVMAASLGLVVNLVYPKLEWDREEAVIKSSMASLISLFFPMILTIIPFVVYMASLVNFINANVFIGLLVMYEIIVILLLWLWLKKRGEKALYDAGVNKN